MLFFLSTVLLFVAAAGAFSYRRDILHPGFWTNIGFIGYAVGGFYFAVFGFERAMFLNLAGIDEGRHGWFALSLMVVLAGLIACNIGFESGNRVFAIDRRNPRALSKPAVGLPKRVVGLTKLCAILLIAVGSAYWLYLAHAAAGGLLSLFRNAGAYRYLLEDAGLTTLPLRLAYAGIELWMLAWLSGARRQALGLLFLPLGFVMYLSSGRISASAVFLFAALLAYFMARQGPVRSRLFMRAFLLLSPLAILFYFYRQYTSYVYIEKPDAFALGRNPFAYADDTRERLAEQADYVIGSLVGGGNVPDLQQVILLIKGVRDGLLSLSWGGTYFDAVRNFLSSGDGPQSVGFRILHVYFPEKVGGPTPGMIGEAILNFWLLAPLALGFFCFAMVWFYRNAARSRSLLTKLLYCKFLVGIWALFLKVDSSLLLGYFWMAVPISLCWAVIMLLANVETGRDTAPRAAAAHS